MSEDAAFLSAIAARPDDPTARLIYADWLDEQGDPRGAYLRALVKWDALPADDPQRSVLASEMAALHAPAEWVALVASVLIEGCEEDDCPGLWQSLKKTADSTRRDCAACHLTVHWCRTTIEARGRFFLNERAAMDPSAVRQPGDLAPFDSDYEELDRVRRRVRAKRARRNKADSDWTKGWAD